MQNTLPPDPAWWRGHIKVGLDMQLNTPREFRTVEEPPWILGTYLQPNWQQSPRWPTWLRPWGLKWMVSRTLKTVVVREREVVGSSCVALGDIFSGPRYVGHCIVIEVCIIYDPCGVPMASGQGKGHDRQVSSTIGSLKGVRWRQMPNPMHTSSWCHFLVRICAAPNILIWESRSVGFRHSCNRQYGEVVGSPPVRAIQPFRCGYVK